MTRMKPAALLAAIALMAGCSAGPGEVTRSFAVGQTFEAYPKPVASVRDGFDLRAKVIAVNGQLELCGAMIVTDPTMRGTYETMLRRARLLVDGRPVMRDLSYFNSQARSFAPFTTDLATCRAIGLPVPARPIRTDLELNAHLYRSPE